MTQLSLTQIALGGNRSIDARFRQWIADNPHVYDEVVAIARRLKAAGHDRIGMKFCLEVLRYQRMLRTTDPESYKINNSYGSRLARMVMEREPDLAEMFETRSLTSA